MKKRLLVLPMNAKNIMHREYELWGIHKENINCKETYTYNHKETDQISGTQEKWGPREFNNHQIYIKKQGEMECN